MTDKNDDIEMPIGIVESVLTDEIPLGDRIEYLEFLMEMVEAKRVQFSREHDVLVKELGEVKNSPLGYPDPLTASTRVILLASIVYAHLKNTLSIKKYYVMKVTDNGIYGILA